MIRLESYVLGRKTTEKGVILIISYKVYYR